MTDMGLRIESASLTSLRINDLAGYSSIGIRLAIAKATVEVSSPVDFLKGSPKKRTNPLVDARKFPGRSQRVRYSGPAIPFGSGRSRKTNEEEKRPRHNMDYDLRTITFNVRQLDLQSAHGGTVGKS